MVISRQPRKKGSYKEAFDRSRGDFTTIIHANTEGLGRLLGFVLTGGETSHYNAVEHLMSIPVKKPRPLLADKSYDGVPIRDALLCSVV